jgi:hypothetical protein
MGFAVACVVAGIWLSFAFSFLMSFSVVISMGNAREKKLILRQGFLLFMRSTKGPLS